MARFISDKEILNIGEYSIIDQSSEYTDTPTILKLKPLKNCYPHVRSEAFALWEKIACLKFPHSKYTVRMEDDGVEYFIEHWIDSDDSFIMVVKANRKTFQIEQAINAATKILKENIIPEINHTLTLKNDYDFLFKCFPELDGTKTIRDISSEAFGLVKKQVDEIKLLKERIAELESDIVPLAKTLLKKKEK